MEHDGKLKVFYLIIVAVAVLATDDRPTGTPVPPKFSNSYTVDGVIQITYADILEPFSAYYDGENERSRIDYYNGLSKTYQLGNVNDNGQSIRIAYMTTEEVTNAQTCFAVNGTGESPVKAQSILPDMDGFEYIDTEVCLNTLCTRYTKRETDGDKENIYNMLFYANVNPARYEMNGYNTLLGSHYDHYAIIYHNYNPNPPDPEVFSLENKTCISFPGPGVDHINVHNPMKEFIGNHDDHVHAQFEDFKNTHAKEYNDVHEHEMRKNVFRQNLRYIHSHNRAGKQFQLATNRFADFTDQEFKMMRGRLHSQGYNGGLPFNREKHLRANIPDSIDWRLYGAVTPVKDQAVCGSCWSFGTVGTIEGAYFLKTGKLERLSEQALVDCSWGFQNNGCDGGEDFRAYQWIMKHGGIPTDNSYGSYIGEDSYCHADNATRVADIASYVNVTEGDIDALKAAIATHGPISVAIDAAHKELLFYSNGVYYNPKCKNGTDDLDHAVLAVGYGVLDGEPYWLIKNSWSTYWGNDGYVLMSQKDNNCGVATAATYVNLK